MATRIVTERQSILTGVLGLALRSIVVTNMHRMSRTCEEQVSQAEGYMQTKI